MSGCDDCLTTKHPSSLPWRRWNAPARWIPGKNHMSTERARRSANPISQAAPYPEKAGKTIIKQRFRNLNPYIKKGYRRKISNQIRYI